MLDPKEIQKRVRENFKNIMAEHAKHNLPVAYSKGNRVMNFYVDGREIDVTEKYRKSK